MPTQNQIKKAIQEVIRLMMDRVMNKVLVEDPFIKEDFHTTKPLYAALVPDEIFKGAHFERRFVTPFGSAWERLAVVAAQVGLGFGVAGHTITGNINAERLRRIQQVLNDLEHAAGRREDRIRPDWSRELAFVLEGTSNKVLPTKVICDVYAEDRRDPKHVKKYAFELKAPLPNSDQTKVSKEKLLKLYSMEPAQVDAAFYALPYNPYGRRQDYNWAFPARWFNMREDRAVLIGDEFWEKIGGTGTYQAFIQAVNEIGPGYKERIYREFLGIEPPGPIDEARL